MTRARSTYAAPLTRKANAPASIAAARSDSSSNIVNITTCTWGLRSLSTRVAEYAVHQTHPKVHHHYVDILLYSELDAPTAIRRLGRNRDPLAAKHLRDEVPCGGDVIGHKDAGVRGLPGGHDLGYRRAAPTR